MLPRQITYIDAYGIKQTVSTFELCEKLGTTKKALRDNIKLLLPLLEESQ